MYFHAALFVEPQRPGTNQFMNWTKRNVDMQLQSITDGHTATLWSLNNRRSRLLQNKQLCIKASSAGRANSMPGQKLSVCVCVCVCVLTRVAQTITAACRDRQSWKGIRTFAQSVSLGHFPPHIFGQFFLQIYPLWSISRTFPLSVCVPASCASQPLGCLLDI